MTMARLHRIGVNLARPSWRVMILLVGVAVAVVGLYRVNQAGIERNRELIVQHERVVEYLCETTNTLDVLIVQFSNFGHQELRTMTGEPRRRFKKRIDALDDAHHALADTRACRGVTG